MTRLCLISDTHNKHEFLDIPKVDLLIHCGDFSMLGTKNEFISFNNWLGELKKDGKIKEALIVYGNHELLSGKDRQEADQLLSNADYKLVHGCAMPFGIKIWGCSHVPYHGLGAHMKNETELYFIYNQIPVNFDVVICHGPPATILDSYRDIPRGSTAMKEVIQKKKPKWFFCGHIHSGRGVDTKSLPGTTFVNCASVDDSYLPLTPIILDV